MCDSTVKWTKEIWPTFSKLGFQVMEKWEEKAIRESDQIITFSKASADIIIMLTTKSLLKVQVFPIPAYIPKSSPPGEKCNPKRNPAATETPLGRKTLSPQGCGYRH
jgi:hypothetical protein